MNIKKIRFIEPGNLPYRRSPKNLYTYEKFIRNPSIGLLTLTTIVKDVIDDTFMYSESISTVRWDDVLDADIVFIGIFTFSALRGYELARFIKERSNGLVVMGGLHASMNYPEAVQHCDYVLLGDGDESVLEFIDRIRHDRPVDIPGVVYLSDGEIIHTGERNPPENIDTIPNRYLLYRYHKMAGHNTFGPRFMRPGGALTTAITAPWCVILAERCVPGCRRMWWRTSGRLSNFMIRGLSPG